LTLNVLKMPLDAVEWVGRQSAKLGDEIGYASALLFESLYWLVMGHWRNQPVRLAAVFKDAVEVGVRAIPIVAIACFATGAMLAMQGIHTLKQFGADSQVVMGIAYSVSREFAPLITGIFVAGRTGSAVAARIGTMMVSQEIDALRVIGVNPVRYLVAPLLVALMFTMPCLTVLANLVAMLGGALYCLAALGMPLDVFFDRSFAVLTTGDVLGGLYKSIVFAMLIAIIGSVNGFQVKSGAEGVGRATTRSVVLCIVFIILADMLCTWFLSR
jgi:phospholipid/cholesterol/gamma-HCH transport system permease protein